MNCKKSMATFLALAIAANSTGLPVGAEGKSFLERIEALEKANWTMTSWRNALNNLGDLPEDIDELDEFLLQDQYFNGNLTLTEKILGAPKRHVAMNEGYNETLLAQEFPGYKADKCMSDEVVHDYQQRVAELLEGSWLDLVNGTDLMLHMKDGRVFDCDDLLPDGLCRDLIRTFTKEGREAAEKELRVKIITIGIAALMYFIWQVSFGRGVDNSNKHGGSTPGPGPDSGSGGGKGTSPEDQRVWLWAKKSQLINRCNSLAASQEKKDLLDQLKAVNVVNGDINTAELTLNDLERQVNALEKRQKQEKKKAEVKDEQKIEKKEEVKKEPKVETEEEEKKDEAKEEPKVETEEEGEEKSEKDDEEKQSSEGEEESEEEDEDEQELETAKVNGQTKLTKLTEAINAAADKGGDALTAANELKTELTNALTGADASAINTAANKVDGVVGALIGSLQLNVNKKSERTGSRVLISITNRAYVINSLKSIVAEAHGRGGDKLAAVVEELNALETDVKRKVSPNYDKLIKDLRVELRRLEAEEKRAAEETERMAQEERQRQEALLAKKGELNKTAGDIQELIDSLEQKDKWQNRLNALKQTITNAQTEDELNGVEDQLNELKTNVQQAMKDQIKAEEERKKQEEQVQQKAKAECKKKIDELQKLIEEAKKLGVDVKMAENTLNVAKTVENGNNTAPIIKGQINSLNAAIKVLKNQIANAKQQLKLKQERERREREQQEALQKAKEEAATVLNNLNELLTKAGDENIHVLNNVKTAGDKLRALINNPTATGDQIQAAMNAVKSAMDALNRAMAKNSLEYWKANANEYKNFINGLGKSAKRKAENRLTLVNAALEAASEGSDNLQTVQEQLVVVNAQIASQGESDKSTGFSEENPSPLMQYFRAVKAELERMLKALPAEVKEEPKQDKPQQQPQQQQAEGEQIEPVAQMVNVEPEITEEQLKLALVRATQAIQAVQNVVDAEGRVKAAQAALQAVRAAFYDDDGNENERITAIAQQLDKVRQLIDQHKNELQLPGSSDDEVMAQLGKISAKIKRFLNALKAVEPEFEEQQVEEKKKQPLDTAGRVKAAQTALQAAQGYPENKALIEEKLVLVNRLIDEQRQANEILGIGENDQIMQELARIRAKLERMLKALEEKSKEEKKEQKKDNEDEGKGGQGGSHSGQGNGMMGGNDNQPNSNNSQDGNSHQDNQQNQQNAGQNAQQNQADVENHSRVDLAYLANVAKHIPECLFTKENLGAAAGVGVAAATSGIPAAVPVVGAAAIGYNTLKCAQDKADIDWERMRLEEAARRNNGLYLGERNGFSRWNDLNGSEKSDAEVMEELHSMGDKELKVEQDRFLRENIIAVY